MLIGRHAVRAQERSGGRGGRAGLGLRGAQHGRGLAAGGAGRRWVPQEAPSGVGPDAWGCRVVHGQRHARRRPHAVLGRHAPRAPSEGARAPPRRGRLAHRPAGEALAAGAGDGTGVLEARVGGAVDLEAPLGAGGMERAPDGAAGARRAPTWPPAPAAELAPAAVAPAALPDWMAAWVPCCAALPASSPLGVGRPWGARARAVGSGSETGRLPQASRSSPRAPGMPLCLWGAPRRLRQAPGLRTPVASPELLRAPAAVRTPSHHRPPHLDVVVHLANPGGRDGGLAAAGGDANGLLRRGRHAGGLGVWAAGGGRVGHGRGEGLCCGQQRHRRTGAHTPAAALESPEEARSRARGAAERHPLLSYAPRPVPLLVTAVPIWPTVAARPADVVPPAACWMAAWRARGERGGGAGWSEGFSRPVGRSRRAKA
jgi:hypothetical protein